MNKPKVSEVVASLTPFFLYPEISDRYTAEINSKIESLKNSMQFIHSRAGLLDYIKSDENALDNILMLLNVSEEYFKRITTVIRMHHGMDITGEWSLSQTRKQIISCQWFQDKIMELLFEGVDSEDFSQWIPEYNLKSFRIDASTIARLSNEDLMSILLKKNYDSGFSADCSRCNSNVIKDCLLKICESKGYILNCDVPVRIGTKDIPVQFTITRSVAEAPIIYVMAGFYLTTGRTQTSFANKVRDLKVKAKENGALTIAIVDGVGWAARQSDLYPIIDHADMTYTLKTINQINELINTL